MKMMHFLFSDASYNHTADAYGISVVDMSDHTSYATTVRVGNNTVAGETYALIYAIEHAVRKGYSRAVFVYDCLSIDVRELEAFFAPMFSKIQFLWLPRGYLSRADALARRTARALTPPQPKPPRQTPFEMLERISTPERRDLVMNASISGRVKTIYSAALRGSPAKATECTKQEIKLLSAIFHTAQGDEKRALKAGYKASLRKMQYLSVMMMARRSSYSSTLAGLLKASPGQGVRG